MRWGGRVSGQISTIPVSAELTTGGGRGGCKSKFFSPQNALFPFSTKLTTGGGNCVDVLGKLCRRFVKPGHFWTKKFFFTLWWGPPFGGGPCARAHVAHA